MADINDYTFDYKEVVEALIKLQDIHEGIWQLSVEFGLAAANIGPRSEDLKPTAIIPIVKMGIQRSTKETNLSVNAGKVNPPKKKG